MRNPDNIAFSGRGTEKFDMGHGSSKTSSASAKWLFLLKLSQPAFRADSAPGAES